MADVLAELPEEVITARPDPSAGRVRLTPPICTMGEDTHFTQFDVLATLGNGRHLMMGDDPRLPKMPAQPRLADFFRHRFVPLVANHLLQSARLAEKAGLDERIVMACLLHDIAMAGLITSDHGYWGFHPQSRHQIQRDRLHWVFPAAEEYARPTTRADTRHWNSRLQPRSYSQGSTRPPLAGSNYSVWGCFGRSPVETVPRRPAISRSPQYLSRLLIGRRA